MTKKYLSAAVIACGLLMMCFTASADIPEFATWERLNQTYEDGHWVVFEVCEGLGEQCIKGSDRDVIVGAQVE